MAIRPCVNVYFLFVFSLKANEKMDVDDVSTREFLVFI